MPGRIYLVRQARYEIDYESIEAENAIQAAERFAAERDERRGGKIAKGDPVLVEVKRKGRWEIDKLIVSGKMVPRYSAVVTR